MAWRREATPCSAPGGVTWARQRLSARAPESLGKPGHRRLRAPAPPFPAPGTSRPVRGRSPGSKGPPVRLSHPRTVKHLAGPLWAEKHWGGGRGVHRRRTAPHPSGPEPTLGVVRCKGQLSQGPSSLAVERGPHGG